MEPVDQTVRPQDSFYHFANNEWLKANKIPAEKSRWSVFNILDERSKMQLKQLFEEEAQKPIASSIISEFYLSGLDVEAVEKNGVYPIQDLLIAVDSIDSLQSSWRVVSQLQKEQICNPFFGIFASPDAKNSSIVVPYIGEDGLGLPDRDYYDTESKKEIREKYLVHISKMFQLIGVAESNANDKASQVLSLETKMALLFLRQVERRDTDKTYNKTTYFDLKSLAPAIQWDTIFANIGGDFSGAIIMQNLTYLTELSKLLQVTELDHIKSYLKFHILTSVAPYLSKSFVDEDFSFYQKTLSGTLENEVRWKRVITTVSNNIRDPVSKAYVERNFTPEAKKSALEMVQVIIAVFRERIPAAEWMSEATKIKALEKLDNFRVKIGYPDKWNDFTSLEGKLCRNKSYLTNLRIAKAFVYQLDNVNQFNKPVDTTQWEMPPFMVNAYYHPTRNEIVFPAAILQPPFFFQPTAESPYGEPDLNFGCIGAVISHEISHGYDDQGRKYDSKGEISDWWTESDTEQFNARAKVMIEQFDKFEINGEKVNGQLTQGENIADLGGVAVSFTAFQKWLKAHPDFKGTDQFTPNQRFFLSYGQAWSNHTRDEMAKQLLVMDPHSPGIWRVNGILPNIPEFLEAFNVKEGDAMYLPPDQRVKIW